MKRKSRQAGVRRKTDVFSVMLAVFCLIIAAYAGILFIDKAAEYERSRRAYDAISAEAVKAPDENSGAGEEEGSDAPDSDDSLVIDWEAFRGEDVCAWLQIDDIGYPVLYSGDNEKYLHHLPDGSYNYGGSIFLDGDADPLFTGQNSILYGHNMADGSMFGSLRKRYGSEESKDHTFSLYLPDGTRHVYQFFSVLSTGKDSDVYSTSFADADEFLSWQEKMKADSLYGNEAQPERGARFVSLSTCNGYAGTSHRFVILAKEL